MSNSKQVYKSQGNVSLFDNEETMEILNAMGNPLEKLSKVIDFEIFREILESNLQKERLTNAGARPYDPVLMFKVLIIQRMYNLGDKQTEFQIRDRISFRDFLGLASGDKVPDEKTIWLFRENLIKKHVFEQLFDDFYQLLESKHMIMNVGTIIDGSLLRFPASATAVRRTSSSRRARATGCGIRRMATLRRRGSARPTRNATRTLTPAGRRKAVKGITDTRTMRR